MIKKHSHFVGVRNICNITYELILQMKIQTFAIPYVLRETYVNAANHLNQVSFVAVFSIIL